MKYSILFLFLATLSQTQIFSQKNTTPQEICAAQKKQNAPPPIFSADPRSDSIDILHTVIELDLTQTAAKRIAGNCRQIFTPKLDGVPEIRLDLQAMTVDSVFLDGQKINFSYQNSVVRTQFPAAKNLGDTSTIRVFYQGQPVTASFGGFYFQGNYAYNIGVGIGIDPPTFGRSWFPCFDNFTERSTFSFLITSNLGNPSFCNGILKNDEKLPGNRIRRTWQLDEPIPTYLACVASGPFLSFQKNFSGENGLIPSDIAAPDTVKLKNSFKNLDKALACFEHWFGPYRWSKIGYSVVPFSGGAMEHATNIAYPNFAVDGSTTYESLMAHEFSHHWWGDLATCSTAGDMWLNEGWASYSEHLFAEWTGGKTPFLKAVDDNHLQVLQNTHVSEGGYRAVSGVPAALTYGSHVYNKGAVVAHNLRGYLGDSLFRVACRAAMETTQFKDWSSADFREKAEAATGKDLTDFFDDWVFAGGYSDFVLDSFQNLVGGKTRVFVKQKLRGAPHFHKNVPLEFTFLNQKHERTSQTKIVSGENSTVDFDLPFQPVFVFLNASHRLNIARADREMIVKTTGTKNFTPAKMELKINTLPADSMLVRVEHHFAAPDDGAAANPLNYVLTNRFWTVRGEFPAGFDGTATVFYDGRGSVDQLDTELFAKTSSSEDSIRLLFRPAAGQPWAEYPNYQKTGATNTDRFGAIQAKQFRAGDYTIGKGVSTLIATDEPQPTEFFATTTPNPAVDFLKITAAENFSKLVIFNQLGQTVQEISFSETMEKTVAIGDFPAGQFWVILEGEGRAAVVGFQKM